MIWVCYVSRTICDALTRMSGNGIVIAPVYIRQMLDFKPTNEVEHTFHSIVGVEAIDKNAPCGSVRPLFCRFE